MLVEAISDPRHQELFWTLYGWLLAAGFCLGCSMVYFSQPEMASHDSASHLYAHHLHDVSFTKGGVSIGMEKFTKEHRS